MASVVVAYVSSMPRIVDSVSRFVLCRPHTRDAQPKHTHTHTHKRIHLFDSDQMIKTHKTPKQKQNSFTECELIQVCKSLSKDPSWPSRATEKSWWQIRVKQVCECKIKQVKQKQYGVTTFLLYCVGFNHTWLKVPTEEETQRRLGCPFIGENAEQWHIGCPICQKNSCSLCAPTWFSYRDTW